MGTGRPHDPLGYGHVISRHGEIEPGLPATEQFEIDRSEQSAIDLSPMLDAVRQVDLETPAQGVETCRRSGKPHPCQPESIDERAADRISLQARQFSVQKREVELGVMNHQPVRTNKGKQLVGERGKGRLFCQKLCGDAMDRESFFGHVAFGIDVSVKFSAGRDVVDELDAGDLDDAMAFAWIQTGRFGVEHDFAQLSSPPFAEESDDRFQTAQGQVAARPRWHHKVRASPFPMIRNLFSQNGVKANLGHPRPPHDTLPLHEGGRRNDQHIIAPALGACLKQQGDVEHDERYPPGT